MRRSRDLAAARVLAVAITALALLLIVAGQAMGGQCQDGCKAARDECYSMGHTPADGKACDAEERCCLRQCVGKACEKSTAGICEVGCGNVQPSAPTCESAWLRDRRGWALASWAYWRCVERGQ